MNELRRERFKRFTSVISYLPHFISIVVVCGMIKDFTSNTGFISIFVSKLTGSEPQTMLNNADLFLPVYVISGIWQGMGWGAIVYTAALTGIDQTLYEAAVIDGAGRWKQVLHVTIPGIMPTIVIMFILETGKVLNVSLDFLLGRTFSGNNVKELKEALHLKNEIKNLPVEYRELIKFMLEVNKK